MTKKEERKGRPGTGLAGERISVDYHSVRLRVPPEVRATLLAAADVLRRPQWRVLVDAFRAYVGEGEVLPPAKVREIRKARREPEGA